MRDVLKIKVIKSNDLLDWANFRRMHNKVNTNIKSAKELYYKKTKRLLTLTMILAILGN